MDRNAETKASGAIWVQGYRHFEYAILETSVMPFLIARKVLNVEVRAVSDYQTARSQQPVVEGELFSSKGHIVALDRAKPPAVQPCDRGRSRGPCNASGKAGNCR